MKAIEDQIKKIISESVSHKIVNSVTDFEKKEIVNLEGNSFCADCNAPSKYALRDLHVCTVTKYAWDI